MRSIGLLHMKVDYGRFSEYAFNPKHVSCDGGRIPSKMESFLTRKKETRHRRRCKINI